MRKSARAYKKLDNWIFGRSIRGDLNILRTVVVPEVIAGVVSKSKSDGAIFRAPSDFLSATRSRIGNSGQKSSQPIKFRRSRPLSHNLALALLRIQFNAMNLTIRPRAAVYGFILTGSKFAIGRPPFFLTLIDSL